MNFILQASLGILHAILRALKGLILDTYAVVEYLFIMWNGIFNTIGEYDEDEWDGWDVLASIASIAGGLVQTIGLLALFAVVSPTIAILELVYSFFLPWRGSFINDIFTLENAKDVSFFWGMLQNPPQEEEIMPQEEIMPKEQILPKSKLEEMHRVEFEIDSSELSPHRNRLPETMLLDARETLAELKNPGLSKERTKQINDLKKVLEDYNNLCVKLDTVESYLALLCGEPGNEEYLDQLPTELITDTDPENPCLFFKQYQVSDERWATIPQSTFIDGKKSIEMLINDPRGTHSHTRDNLLNPQPYQSCKTRYSWHEYNLQKGVSQELGQYASQINNLLNELSSAPSPEKETSWLKSVFVQLFFPPIDSSVPSESKVSESKVMVTPSSAP